MVRAVCAIESSATIGDAAAAIRNEQVGLLCVVENSEVVGIVTRGDLLRVGVTDKELGVERCGRCRSAHGIQIHPLFGEIEFCIDCVEETLTVIDYRELEPG